MERTVSGGTAGILWCWPWPGAAGALGREGGAGAGRASRPQAALAAGERAGEPAAVETREGLAGGRKQAQNAPEAAGLRGTGRRTRDSAAFPARDIL